MLSELKMKALCGERLLAAWDRGRNEYDPARAVTVLAAALPEADRDGIAELSLAERDQLLLELRRLTFGPTFEAFGSCATCAAPMEFNLPVEQLLAQLTGTPSTEVAWVDRGVHLRLRAATTLDLLAARDTVDDAAGERLLLTRCCTGSGAAPGTAFAEWPSVREQFERLHAGTEQRCAVTCPRCACTTSLEFDIAHFTWLEVRRAAHCLLGDIHTLALHYGWREADIVQLAPQRRHTYLDLLGGGSI